LYMALATVAIATPVLVLVSRRYPPMGFGLGFFLVNVALVLQFVTVGQSIMADRFTYVPYIGLFLCLGWWLDEPMLRAARFRTALTCAGLLLIVCVGQTWARCQVWRNGETLWNDVIDRYPNRIAAAYNNRGAYYQSRGQFELALEDYNEALALNSAHALPW